MTDKQIVEDFLHFLNTHKGYIVTDTGADQTYNYLELRRAIINCLKQATKDEYKDECVEKVIVNQIFEDIFLCANRIRDGELVINHSDVVKIKNKFQRRLNL